MTDKLEADAMEYIERIDDMGGMVVAVEKGYPQREIASAAYEFQRALDADDRVLKDPAPVIAVGELADSSVNLLVRPWCKGADYWGLRWDLTRKIKEDLEAAGCSIPYPQQDVYMHQVSAG